MEIRISHKCQLNDHKYQKGLALIKSLCFAVRPDN